MDVTRFLELRTAASIVLDGLAERADRPRFHIPQPDGTTRTVTWAEHVDEIRRLAAFLLVAGLEPGDRVAVLGPNSTAWAAAALGIQAARGVLVPIYPASTPDQVAYVLRSSRARFLFAHPSLLERARAVPDALARVERAVALPSGRPEDEPAYADALSTGAARLAGEPDLIGRTASSAPLDEPTLLFYTSGTTGHPKGVPLTHRNVGVNGRDWLRCFADILEENAADVLWLPMSHIFGLGQLNLGHRLGFETTLAAPQQVLELLPRVRPTVFMSVPAYWQKLTAPVMAEPDPARRREMIQRATGGRLKLCVTGGAGLAAEIKEVLHDAGVFLIDGYGLTETSPTLTINRPREFRFDSVGKPLPSVELRLDADGEILARGESVFTGYDNDPEATRAAFTEDGWFRTGDIGRFTEDGHLQIVDRKKDILVTAGGKNIPPVNIEMRFSGDPAIAHVVVYGDGKHYLVAGVWLNPGAAATADEAQALVAERVRAVNATLARHETIKRFFVVEQPLTVEAGFLTTSLKIRRRAIYDAFRDRFEALYREEGGADPGRA